VIRPDQVWLAVEPVDLRLGIDGLSRKVQEALGLKPCDGSAYAFRNRSGTRIKLLVWDGTGVWLCVRRLHQGRFTRPQGQEAVWSLTEAQWARLVRGVDWRRLEIPPSAEWQV
jgi:transposase